MKNLIKNDKIHLKKIVLHTVKILSLSNSSSSKAHKLIKFPNWVHSITQKKHLKISKLSLINKN
jgi:hypothetical protein